MSTVLVGAFVEGPGSAWSFAATPAESNEFWVGQFTRGSGLSGTVELIDGSTAVVNLVSGSFLNHGIEGVVSGLESFVPGEEVVIKGTRSSGAILATELQSVYTGTTFTAATTTDLSFTANTAGGDVIVPAETMKRQQPAGVTRGESFAATVWTDPRDGVATAVGLAQPS
ncbi:MAG TPA: hypothetical protein VGO31_02195 [Microbacteriaceae bacterium]|nr:hypothetical protein [Microbacteriaceae bacterium]